MAARAAPWIRWLIALLSAAAIVLGAALGLGELLRPYVRLLATGVLVVFGLALCSHLLILLLLDPKTREGIRTRPVRFLGIENLIWLVGQHFQIFCLILLGLLMATVFGVAFAAMLFDQ